MEGRLAPAAAERRLASAAAPLAVAARRMTEVAPSLGRGTGSEAIRFMTGARAAEATGYLDFARHVVRRWSAQASVGSVVADAPGMEDLKPDPRTARTPADLNKILREYRAWAGEPSFEEMSRRCGGRPAKSTFWTALHGTALPKLKVVTAIVTGCGGSTEDIAMFASAWRSVQGRPPTGAGDGQPRRLRSIDGKKGRPA